MKKINRRKFFKNVIFGCKDAKKYLYEPILYFAKQNELRRFENITNYVSHATHSRDLATGKLFEVCYPVTILGTSISEITIIDAKSKRFNISLQPNKIIYYEKDGNNVNVFAGIIKPDKDEKWFYEEKILVERLEK